MVELTSAGDNVAKLASGEARVGATLAGAAFVSISVDGNGGDVELMTKLLGQLPIAPATLVYTRPANLFVTLPGINDHTTVQQAAANAAAPATTATTAPATATTAAPTGAG